MEVLFFLFGVFIMDYKFFVLTGLAVLFLMTYIFSVIMINKIVLTKYNAIPKLEEMEVELKRLISLNSQYEYTNKNLREKIEVQERLLKKFRGTE